MSKAQAVGKGHWKPTEIAALRRYYVRKGLVWEGWEHVLPGRSKQAISSKANNLGLHYEPNAGNVAIVQLDANTCGECIFYRKNVDGRGRCAERHAVGLFGKAPEVFAHYDAKICEHRKGKIVRVECADDGHRGCVWEGRATSPTSKSR